MPSGSARTTRVTQAEPCGQPVHVGFDMRAAEVRDQGDSDTLLQC